MLSFFGTLYLFIAIANDIGKVNCGFSSVIHCLPCFLYC